MKTSIATVSISGTFAEKLEAIAAAGFDGIEIFEQDFIASDFRPEEVGRMVRDAGLEITLFQPFRDFEGLPEPHRSRAFARAARKFDLMNQLGTDLMLVCSSVHPAAMGGIDRMAADFAELGELARSHGVRVGFEALAWGRHVNDHRDAWEVVRRADHPNVGLILDSFHTLARRIDPDTIRRIPGDRIFFVQLADAPAIEMDPLYWSRHFRNMPGEGDLDVTAFLRAVLATGYAGPLSLEIFNDQFRAGLPRLVALDGRRSLIAALDRARRQEPTLAVNLPPFPPPAPVSHVEFVEFATSPQEASALEAFLQAAGFARAGAHVSKPVALWRQGGVNILVNTDQEGFARRSYAAHGTTVAEVALARARCPGRPCAGAGAAGTES
ncbi:Sugar phosphate isomerase/epimerase [Rubellimicrobium thermophilum DSM 16684]|uniref:Sugar phosphate isomerase/epimerase n=1 Tax=Rubellimicrobium thermophilum DSM 16684 TaxID=1123069 RepID=S9QP36_9RHOB|nr:Sugar phosphate isomerase/epimerase [Rubellimicrobium thermophilum DSM 16684]